MSYKYQPYVEFRYRKVKRNGHIYKITSPTGKIYIGSTLDIKQREYLYRNLHCKSQTKLYHSLKKYGFGIHVFEIIKECGKDVLLKEEALAGELFDVLGDNGLNCNLPKSSDVYYSKSYSTLQKQSASMKGKMSGNKNPQFGRKGCNHPAYGRKHTVEELIKISNTHKGKILSEDTKMKMSSSKKNKMTGSAHFASKSVINTITGQTYVSIKSASALNDIKYKTLVSAISGRRNNNTIFRYL